MLRIHKSIADNPFRVKNAFEDGMLIEDTRRQQWIPNAEYFNSSRGYIIHEDAVDHTQFWYDYISTDLKTRFSAQLRNPVLRDSVLTSLRFLITALGRHSNHVSLAEKFEIIPSKSLLRSMRTWHSRSGVQTILIFFSTLDLVTIHQYWEWLQLCEKG